MLSLAAIPLTLAAVYANTRYAISRESYEASMRSLADTRAADPDPI